MSIANPTAVLDAAPPTAGPATAEAPSQSAAPATPASSPPDIQSGDLDQVVAAAARGDYDREQGTAAGAVPSENGAAAGDQTASAAAPEAGPEDFKRKYESVSGNNYQLSQVNQQLQRQLAEHQTQLQQAQVAQDQARAQYERQVRQMSDEWEIRNALPDPALQQQAIAEYRAQQQQQQQAETFNQASNAYVGYLRQQQEGIQQGQLAVFRNSLPQVMPGLARHIAGQLQAPAEPLVEIVSDPAMAKVLQMVGSVPEGVPLARRDLDLVSEVLAAVATVESRRDGVRRQENGRAATATGAFRPDPGVPGRGGLSEVERIKALPEKDFDTMVERLTRAAERERQVAY